MTTLLTSKDLKATLNDRLNIKGAQNDYERLQSQFLLVQKEIDNGKFIKRPWQHFMTLAYTYLSPQQWGPLWEKKLIKDMGFSRKDKKKRGDCLDHNGNIIEIKASVISYSNPLLNVVQIRPYQKANFYITMFDLRNIRSPKAYLFNLTHQQMIKEIERLNGNMAHGTEDQKDKFSEIRFSLDLNSEDFARWIKEYLVQNYFEKK